MQACLGAFMRRSWLNETSLMQTATPSGAVFASIRQFPAGRPFSPYDEMGTVFAQDDREAVLRAPSKNISSRFAGWRCLLRSRNAEREARSIGSN